MKKTLSVVLVLAIGLPAFAGDIHGKVTVKGARNSADAVVYVETIAGKTFTPPKDHARIDQSNLLFKPHVLAILAGTTVDFRNSDVVLHNVFSPDACAGKVNLGSWPKGQSKSFTFKKECFATLLCNVHPEMEGFVAAVPTPYFAVTGPDGSYRIADVPDGSYALKVWHPRAKAAAKKVDLHGSAQADFEISK